MRHLQARHDGLQASAANARFPTAKACGRGGGKSAAFGAAGRWLPRRASPAPPWSYSGQIRST